MEFLGSSRRRSRISHLLYVILNIGLALALLFVVRTIESPLIAVVIVTLSKWRVFAVRPRFWRANIMTNTVDFIVSLSVVAFLYAAGGELWLETALTIGYIMWLLYIKPRSSSQMVATQGGVAVFMGVSAVMTYAHMIDVAWVVLAMGIIGYSTMRHILTHFEDPHINTLSYIWAFVFAEAGWIAYHWTFAYTLQGFGEIKLVQIAVILSLFCFVGYKAYLSRREYGIVRSQDIILPALLTISITLVFVLFFNSVGGAGGLI